MSLPFLTAYDPLGRATGSIDPLGALRSYGALVELLLPGVTTVTTRSRYLSMLCAALANAATYRSFPPGPVGLAARRRAVEPFERLWALACAAARARRRRGAADDLRGVSFAERRLEELRESGEPAGPEFLMLKSQARTGGAATYWTLLEGGDLVTPEGGLTREGKELANHFPPPPLTPADCARLADPSAARPVALPLAALEEWGDTCHLGAPRADERRGLAGALRSDDRRDAVARALLRYQARRPLPAAWDLPALRRLRSHLADDSEAERLALPTVLDAVAALEPFHEAALAVFQHLLWWGTECAGRPVADLVADSEFAVATAAVRTRAAALAEFSTACAHPEVRRALRAFLPFAQEAAAAPDARSVLELVLRRHQRVQSGKLDGGVPKRDWVRPDPSSAGRFLRPAPLFQETERPMTPRGRALTHPYRIEPFAAMLREVGVLAPETQEAARHER